MKGTEKLMWAENIATIYLLRAGPVIPVRPALLGCNTYVVRSSVILHGLKILSLILGM